MHRSICTAALLSASVLAGCVVEPARVHVRAPAVAVSEVIVSRPPPPLREEVIPPPPRGPVERFVWQPGHWRWDGHEYRWNPGHYEELPAHAAEWVPHHWDARGNQWVFVPGHWVYR